MCAAMDSRRLRAAFLSDAILERNGVGTYYGDLVEHLRGRIDCAALFCPRRDAPAPYQGPALPLPGDPTQNIYLPRSRRIYKRLKQLSPAVVVAAIPGPFGFLGFLFARRFGIPLVAGYHTAYSDLFRLYWQGPWGGLMGRLSLGWHDLFFRSAAAVVANSEPIAACARQLGLKNVSLAGTPIARAFLDAAPPRQKLEIKHVLFAGRLAPEKNLAAVVAAAEKLPQFSFVIAGDGPLRDDVSESAKVIENLAYLGWVDRKALCRAMDACDLLVLPSAVEAFGTIAVEAMARGRCVLVSGNCGLLSWPSLARGVFAMQPHEPLHHALLRIARLPADVRRATAAAGQAAARDLNEKTVQHWLNIFHQAATCGRRRPMR